MVEPKDPMHVDLENVVKEGWLEKESRYTK